MSHILVMNNTEKYRIKVKSGRNLIEIEGDKAFVDEVFKDIRKIFPKQAQRNAAPRKRGPKPKPRPAIDLKELDPKDIISRLEGKATSLKVLASGYILNKKLRKREFRAKEMTTFMKEFGLDVPNNLTYYFRRFKDEGTFTQGRKQGRFKITDIGIEHLTKKLE
ncbi:MAG: hypothetical protein DRN37_05150 [Thermoplasmata archaeon]|nr:MAG: hypothetical protein DRN37_05150 [Thermoplasmata archaeon]